MNQPIKDLPDVFWEKFLFGTGKEKILFHYEKNGGYDEDFTGTCYDDNDIVDRLKFNGCNSDMEDFTN